MKVTSLALLSVLAGIGSAVPVGFSKRQDDAGAEGAPAESAPPEAAASEAAVAGVGPPSDGPPAGPPPAGPPAGAGPPPAANQNIDITVLQFALTLEHLENAYYKEIFSRFDVAAFSAAGFDETFFNNMLFIAQDEAKHVTLLEGAISGAGSRPVAPCTYNFGITSLTQAMTLSTVLEAVGTSAYLGAAGLLENKDILTTAGAILVTEALHTSQQRIGIGAVPAPNDLGTPLDANAVFTLASSFIVECPADNEPLPFTVLPGLAVDTSACPAPVGEVLFKRDGHAPPAPPAHHGAMVPEVVASEASPPVDGHALEMEKQRVHEANVKWQDEQNKKQQEWELLQQDHGFQQWQENFNKLKHEGMELGKHFAIMFEKFNMFNHGKDAKVDALPCPFLREGDSATFIADAEVAQGSFVTIVSGLSVVSVPAQISGTSAIAAVPAGVSGTTYVFLTNRAIEDNKLAPDSILHGPAILEVQPAPPRLDFGQV